jgi:hypothetical protein
MRIIANVNLVLITIILIIVIIKDMNPQKWYSFIFYFYTFLSGFLFGYAWENIMTGLQFGIILLLIILSTIFVTNWQRQYYKKEGESWLIKHRHDKSFPITLLTHIVTKINDKYHIH